MKNNSLAKNSFYSAFYRTINILFPLFFSIYSSHIILADGTGKIAFAQTIITYFTLIAALGLPNYGVKIIGGCQEKSVERDKAFSELFILNFVSTFACLLLFLLCFFTINKLKDNYLLLIFGSLILFNFLNIDWFFEGIEEFKYVAVRTIIIKIVSIIALIAFVREKEHLPQCTAILCFSTVGNYLLNIFFVRKHAKLTFKGINLKKHLIPVFILLASACATEIYTMLDSTIIGSFCTDSELGYYSNAVKTVRMAYVLITAICTAYLPRLSLYFKNKEYDKYNSLINDGFNIVLLLSVPCFAGLLINSDLIINVFFGESFMPATLTLRILSVLSIVFSVAYICGHIVLISSNKEKGVLIASIVGAITNLGLNFLLIKPLGYNGVAIASVAAEILVTIILLILGRKLFSIKFKLFHYISILVATGFMALSVYLIRLIPMNVYFKLFISVIVAVIVYFLVLYVFKNEYIKSFILLIKSKLRRKGE